MRRSRAFKRKFGIGCHGLEAGSSGQSGMWSSKQTPVVISSCRNGMVLGMIDMVIEIKCGVGPFVNLNSDLRKGEGGSKLTSHDDLTIGRPPNTRVIFVSRDIGEPVPPLCQRRGGIRLKHLLSLGRTSNVPGHNPRSEAIFLNCHRIAEAITNNTPSPIDHSPRIPKKTSLASVSALQQTSIANLPHWDFYIGDSFR